MDNLAGVREDRRAMRDVTFGGVLVNLAFRQSFLTYGTGNGAYGAFIALYTLCLAVTWAVYLRRPGSDGTAAQPEAR